MIPWLMTAFLVLMLILMTALVGVVVVWAITVCAAMLRDNVRWF